MDIPCVGAIIHDASGRLLVVKRGRPPSMGLWSIPGGRVERDESQHDAVRREVREETGLDVQVGEAVGSVVLASALPGDRYLVTDYLATLSAGPPLDPVAGDDAQDVRWVTRPQFLALDVSPGLAPALHGWGVWERLER